MNQRTGVMVALGLLMLSVGALLIKGFAAETKSDPTASVQNGAPEGMLAWRMLLENHQVKVTPIGDWQPLEDDTIEQVWVPPPQGSAWTPEEVRAILDDVNGGKLELVLLCDEDEARHRRLLAFENMLGVRCQNEHEGRELFTAEPPAQRARGTLPSYRATLEVTGTGRVNAPPEVLAIPAWVDEDQEVVVLRQPWGAGWVTVIGTTTLFANDGIARGDNAALAFTLLRDVRHIAFDEVHHSLRQNEVLARAFAGAAPRVAGFALLLLLPVVLLGFAPRRGEAPGPVPDDQFEAARTSVDALVALYARAHRAPTRVTEDISHGA